METSFINIWKEYPKNLPARSRGMAFTARVPGLPYSTSKKQNMARTENGSINAKEVGKVGEVGR